MKRRVEHRQAGQSTLELTWLFITIIAVILAMQPLLKRAVSGRMRSSIDQVSQSHFDPDVRYNYVVRTSGAREEKTKPSGSSTSTVLENPYVANTYGEGQSGEVSVQAINVGQGNDLTDLIGGPHDPLNRP